MNRVFLIIILSFLVACNTNKAIKLGLIYPNEIEVSFDSVSQIKIMIPLVNPNIERTRIKKVAASCSCVILGDGLDGTILEPNKLFFLPVVITKKIEEDEPVSENIVIRVEGMEKVFYPVRIFETKNNK